MEELKELNAEDYKNIADALDNVTMTGTIHSLPSPLSSMTKTRIKVQGILETLEKERILQMFQSVELPNEN